MKLDMAIEELHRSENHLVAVLLSMSDRHKTDHEVFHVTRDMAKWSQIHVAELARIGHDFGLDLDPETNEDLGALATLRQRASELVGRRPEPGLLLLADLRHLYREAARPRGRRSTGSCSPRAPRGRRRRSCSSWPSGSTPRLSDRNGGPTPR